MFRYPASSDLTRAGYVIAGDRFAILVAADVHDGLIARLWDAAAAETSVLEDVLSVVVAVGVDALPDFAVAEFAGTSPETLRVAARGAATITTSAGRTIEGRDVRTWTETTISDADGIRLSFDGEQAAAQFLPLGLGVIRADEVSWGRPPRTPRADAGDSESAARTGGAKPRLRAAARRAAATSDDAPVTGAGRDNAPAASARPAAPRAAAPSLDDMDVLQTLSIDRSLFARPLDEEFELPAFLTDDDAPAADRSADDDAPEDRTLLGGRRAAPAPAAAIGYVLRVDPGRDLPLDRPVVLGRGPRPARHPGARIETVPSPAKEISGSHLEVALDGDHLLARDLDSTNGTIVRPQGSEPRLLRSGATLRVPLGTVFDLGDGVTAVFQVGE
ncbi:FHA domain-containing protein [Microbacterium sp. 179-B 1A2 NHS]|uniref:FHA domain-containing protein n=1 Tax=Microbacterium sp. 179-B 1A2 NHS TaxID=3142383 RepID=UPI0039A27D46